MTRAAKRLRVIFTHALIATVLAGCAQSTFLPAQIVEGSSFFSGWRTSDAAYKGLNTRDPAVLVSPGQGEGADQRPRKGGKPIEEATLNFNETDVRDVAQSVLGEVLGVTFTIDPAVQGSITFSSAAPVPGARIVATFEEMLAQVKAILVVNDGLYQILPADGATGRSGVARGDGYGSELMVLRVASAKRIEEMISPFVAGVVQIASDPSRNAILITGPGPGRQNVRELVRLFDVDSMAGRSYALLQVRNGSPVKLAKDISTFMQAGPDQAQSDAVTVSPVEQANAILVTTRDRRTLDRAVAYFRKLDAFTTLKTRTMHVYYVENGDAADLLPALRGAFGLSDSQARVTEGDSATSATSPDVSLTSRGRQQQTGRERDRERDGPGGSPRLTGEQTEEQRTPAAPEMETQQKPGQDRLSIYASKRNNALLIYATEAEYEQVLGVLRRIDIRAAQVMIEATIAEVTLNDTLKYGTKAYFRTKWGSIALDGALGVNSGFYSLSKVTPSIALQALQEVTKVRILSAPQLMTMENEKAKLQVGSTVPIQTQASQGTLTGSPVINSIDYRDTGVVLEITPRVGARGLVTLDIQQVVSSVAETTSSKIDSPTFDERRVKSRVAVNDGETVAIAGLIRSQETETSSGIPGMSRIPYVGGLFGTKGGVKDSTELLVIITPHVVRDQTDLRALTAALRGRLGSSFATPAPAAVPARR